MEEYQEIGYFFLGHYSGEAISSSRFGYWEVHMSG